MTSPFIEYLIEPSCRPSHDRSPTPLELQRWEDDGGAVRPESSSRRTERRHRALPEELTAE